MSGMRLCARHRDFCSENSLRSDSSPQKNMRRVLSVALGAVLLFVPVAALAQVLPEKPAGYVTDAAHVLSAEKIAALETRLTALDASTTEQIAVVTVPDMGGDYIEHYAATLFEKWGIGEAKKDTGVLLILAVKERELRIEVGYGLEGALPDSVANAIIQDEMVPLLKEGDYDGAVERGVASIVTAIDGEYHAPATRTSSADPTGFLIFGVIALQWLAAILGRSKRWWPGGVLGGIGGLILSSVLGWWLIGGALLTVALALFGLLFDFLVSRSYGRSVASGSTPPWWTGGGGFGGGRSGGFGGFGGGMSGGGGASGRW